MSSLEQFKKNLVANGVGQIIALGLQPLVVLSFAHFWGLTKYGLWLMFFTLPGYLSLTDLGLSYCLSASIPMLATRKQWKRANLLISYGIVTQLLMVILGFLVITVLLLGTSTLFGGISELQQVPQWLPTILALYLYAALAQVTIMVGVSHKALGRYHFFTNLNTLFRFLETLLSFWAAVANFGFLAFALCLVLLRLGNLLAVATDLFSKDSRIRPVLRMPTKRFIRSNAILSLAHCLFPTGNALLLQTPVILVGTLLGPAFAAQLNIIRQAPRLLNIACTVLTNAIQPAIALAPSRDCPAVTQVIHQARLGVVLISFFGSLCGLTAIQSLFLRAHLFGNATGWMLLAYLTPVLIDSSWLVQSASLAATNQHARTALCFCILSMGTVVSNWFLIPTLGLYGVAVSAAVLSAIMSFTVRIEFRRRFGTNALGQSELANPA